MSRSFVASHLQSQHVLNAAHPMNDLWQNRLLFHSGSSLAQPYLNSSQDGSTFGCTSNQYTRGSSSLLDTSRWSPVPLPSLAFTHPTSRTQFPLTFVQEPHVSPEWPFATKGTLACGKTPEPLVMPHSEVLPDLSSGDPAFRSARHHHASLGTDVNILDFYPPSSFAPQPDHPAFTTSNILPPSSSSSTQRVTSFAHDEGQPPIVIYRAPKKKGPCRRRCQRACAINIEGLWIDRDDLHSGAGQGSGMISVHECQWAKSTNSCGMWIMGSRSRVGAHIRNWHRQRHADSKVKCPWDECTTVEAMLKDSISRHIVTVHLGEGYHCLGCHQEFPRKDVYDKHVENGDVCRSTGAAIVYGTERREIDTRRALQRGFGREAVRYADR
ncbi:hypothetical protein L210DRAFT_3574491 [Boletus edulis BED1]|uniref:Uncharacterized protein n=1 Tax=Boletus edulis BED1 TaxID=1328754 RepID=A0AAD4BDN1_BOLED|nr:hypothetical protein L210DRAFT_3574491 [Boletus edulis BED1]